MNGQGSTTARLKKNSGYPRFFMRSIKRPMLFCQDVTGEDKHYGITSLLIVSILIPILTLVQNHSNTTQSLVDTLPATIIIPFVYHISFFFVLCLTILVFIRLMKTDYHFGDVLARFGSFLNVSIFFTAISLLFQLLTMSTLSTFCLFLALLHVLVAIAYTMHSFKAPFKTGLDPIYATLALYVLLGLWFTSTSDPITPLFLQSLLQMF
ncbi:hypothetical protein [Desertibacillus haloalkaliphilus]|uniref:hypothetical protein n=1 Tax=Desertibacillus haloalkaliphilus TaxID=1328930 RepID=UPI001C258446|nr:hypothetical protein [Desertibacillus haloalkaliphilus]MBU8908004.1 hypothetical protein [Desertibacillus haloalkaliphilus]